jgi:hypothetical protein
VGKANKVCANAGISSLTDSSHCKQVEKMQIYGARRISEEQLPKNRRGHVLACGSLPYYLGVMKFNCSENIVEILKDNMLLL